MATTSASKDFVVDVQLLLDHPDAALLPVLKLLKGWEAADGNCVTVDQLSGAMTNLVYRCGLQKADGSGEQQAVLMRVHASSTELFDRGAELAAAQAVAAAGLGPRLLLLFANGRIEEFLTRHVTLTAADIHEHVVSQTIAATMARFHSKLSAAMPSSSTHPQHQAGVHLWQQMRSWLAMVHQLTSAVELKLLGMSNIEQEIQQLEQVLMSTHPCWIAMCHNDAQYGNIMAKAPANDSIAGDAAEQAAGAEAAGQQLQQLSLKDVPGLRQGGAASIASGCSDVDELSCMSVAGSCPSLSGLSGIVPTGSAAAVAGHSDVPDSSASGGAATSQQQQEQLQQASGRQGRSRAVQLRDGSLVLPGMKSRPRGQSPESAKRPAAAAAAATGAAVATLAAAAAAAAAAEQHVGSPDVALKPPSAAAVLRHSSSQGELLLPALASDSSATATAGAGRRSGRISFPGSDISGDDESVEDSEDADDLLLPVLMAGEQRATGGGAGAGAGADDGSMTASAVPSRSSSSAGGGGGGNGSGSGRLARSAAARASVGGVSELAADAAAAASKSSRYYRQLRRKRLTPAAGIEFPTFQGSDMDSDGSGEDYGSVDSAGDDECAVGSSSSSSGVGSDGDGNRASSEACLQSQARRQQLQSGKTTSRKQVAGSRPLGLSAPAAVAVARAAARHRSSDAGAEPLLAADHDAVEGLTLIDYEYSGFNPVAYDIANHWCEWAADYHSEQSSLLDFGRLPTEQQQWDFVQAYLAALLSCLGVAVPGVTVPAAPVLDGAADSSLPSAAAAGVAAALRAPVAADGSRSEKWSTMSSRGASVLSLPDTDVPYDQQSQCSLSLSVASRNSSDSQTETTDHHSRLAAAAAKNLAVAVSDAELRNVWTWLQRYQQPQQQQSQQQQLPAAAAAAAACTSGGSGVEGFSSMDELTFERLCGSLLEAARAYMAASHLYWTLWGVIQSRVSEVDWDFHGYALQRWRQYLVSKPAGLLPPAAQESYEE